MDKKKIKIIVEFTIFILALCAITFFYYFKDSAETTDSELQEVGIIKVTDTNFQEEVLESDKPVVLEFSSNMCPPCLTMIPTLISLAKNNNDIKVAILNTNETEAKETASKYNIEATPTIFILKNGEIIKTFVGATSEKEILKEIKY